VNRIGGGEYKIGRKTFHTELNDGTNTLHSGTNNWSFRTWEVTDFTEDSITFSIHDASNSSIGFIGSVDASVTYSVEGSTWKINIEATSPQAKTRAFIPSTPFLISSD
jgi:aldose 1-epimerase